MQTIRPKNLFLSHKYLTNFLNVRCGSITVTYNPPPFSRVMKDPNLDSLQINDLLSLDSKVFNTKKATDLLYSCSYKFEDELDYLDNTNFELVKSEKLQFIFLYILSKARIVKCEQIIPFIRSYDLFQSTVLTGKCWEIIGRILNNSLNMFSDQDLIDICFHLTRIKTIPDNVKELEIFWQRIVIQSPNWLNNLHKIDIISLIYLLQISKTVNFPSDSIEKIIEEIKIHDGFFYRLEDLSIISLLLKTMESNDIFDGEIFENSLEIIPIFNEKTLSSHKNLVNFSGFIWTVGNMMMKFSKSTLKYLDKINVRRLNSINNNIIRNENQKLFLKFNKSLFLLGLPKDDLINSINNNFIDPKYCDEKFEFELIDSIYTIELIRNPQEFFEKYSVNEFDKIVLPHTIKAFYFVNNNGLELRNVFVLEKYLNVLSNIRQILGKFLEIKPSEKHELMVGYSDRIIGLVPCDFVDFIYPEPSDIFLKCLSEKFNSISCFKICFDDFSKLESELEQKNFIQKYFSEE